LPRTVTREATIHGQQLMPGDLVHVVLGSANRDPRRFADPEQLNIRRENNRHVAFGYGTHFCLGASLARMEAGIAIPELFRRLPNMRLCEDRPPVWKQSMVQRGMERFWLRLR